MRFEYLNTCEILDARLDGQLFNKGQATDDSTATRAEERRERMTVRSNAHSSIPLQSIRHADTSTKPLSL
jgi:hypothetical protein